MSDILESVDERINGKGRPRKVECIDILDSIQENDRITVEELARIHKVCKETIRNRLRELRDDGENIIFDEEGLFYIDKINNDEDLRLYRKYLKWILKTSKGVALCGNNTGTLLKESKEYLKTQLSSDERKILMKWNAQINNLLSYISVEDDMS